MIETIEKELGLRPDWRAYPKLRERYKWLLELEEKEDPDLIKRLRTEIEEEVRWEYENYYSPDDVRDIESGFESEIDELKDKIQELETLLEDNNIEYD